MKLLPKLLLLVALAVAVVIVGKILLLLVVVAVVMAMVLFLLKAKKQGEYYDPDGYDPEIDTEDFEEETVKPQQLKAPKVGVKDKLKKRKADKVIADLEKQFKQ